MINTTPHPLYPLPPSLSFTRKYLFILFFLWSLTSSFLHLSSKISPSSFIFPLLLIFLHFFIILLSFQSFFPFFFLQKPEATFMFSFSVKSSSFSFLFRSALFSSLLFNWLHLQCWRFSLPLPSSHSLCLSVSLFFLSFLAFSLHFIFSFRFILSLIYWNRTFHSQNGWSPDEQR